MPSTLSGTAGGHPAPLALQGLSRRADLGPAQQQLTAWLSGQDVGARALYACELVLEEWLANLFEHAVAAEPGHAVQAALAVRRAGDEIVMTFSDNAQPFDPTARAAPALPTSLDDARPGGLGLLLVQRWSRRMTYEPQPGGNRLTVVIGNPPASA